MTSKTPALRPIRGRSLVADEEHRHELAGRLRALTYDMTRATLAEMERRHAWYAALAPQHRSWIALVAQSGIEHFAAWFADEGDEPVDPVELFDAAPRQAMRRITLHQTVELVQTTIDVVEEQLTRLPEADQPVLNQAIVYFSRNVAFAAADLYATAAERRGEWDARLEALVVDCVVRGVMDEETAARASALGWRSPAGVCAIAGFCPDNVDEAVADIRDRARATETNCLVSQQGIRLVVIAGRDDLTSNDACLTFAGTVTERFGPGHVVVGPATSSLLEAPASAIQALSGLRVADAWTRAPRLVHADDVLPERVVAGDTTASERLLRLIYRPLAGASTDLVTTLTAYFLAGGSIEATARALFLHANTVRYRLARVAELTGYTPNDPRDGYALRLAMTLGRLATQGLGR